MISASTSEHPSIDVSIALTFVLTAALYVVILLQRKQNPFLLVYKAKAPIFFAAAGVFVAYSGGIYAIQNTTVANAMLLFASAPFITSILAYALLREKIRY